MCLSLPMATSIAPKAASVALCGHVGRPHNAACLRVARQMLTSASVGSKAGVCRLYLCENSSFDRSAWSPLFLMSYSSYEYHFSTCFSSWKHRMTTPPNLDIGVKENSRFNSSKIPESRLASSAGGREDPKPSLPLKHYRHRKCANTTKWSSSCVSVLAFSQSFFEALLVLSKCIWL
jgi:hypothetical protein